MSWYHEFLGVVLQVVSSRSIVLSLLQNVVGIVAVFIVCSLQVAVRDLVAAGERDRKVRLHVLLEAKTETYQAQIAAAAAQLLSGSASSAGSERGHPGPRVPASSVPPLF